MSVKKFRESKCDICQRIFYRKLVPNREKKGESHLTKINEVSYWTDGKDWKNYKILCRYCLNVWFEKYKIDFTDLVEKKKQQLFYHYRYLGIISKEKELYADQ